MRQRYRYEMSPKMDGRKAKGDAERMRIILEVLEVTPRSLISCARSRCCCLRYDRHIISGQHFRDYVGG